MRKPDFERNTLKVLQKGIPERPCLFDLFLNPTYYLRLSGRKEWPQDPVEQMRTIAEAMAAAGYDYASVHASDFYFPTKPREYTGTVSINDGCVITDWESFEKYQWMDAGKADYSRLEKIAQYLPEGQKLMVYGPNGMLENTIGLVGYENLCIMVHEEPELVKEITDRVGQSLVTYYEIAAQSDAVGIIVSNDDWGFNTQTFLSPAHMREYIFPWHKKIVEIAHKNNKPCVLHSCGYFGDVIEDIIEELKFDGRHSYEDNIIPVEKAYDQYGGRIAILGGMDMDMMTRADPDTIYRRSRAMVERSREKGGYALGTGNSVPQYIPFENYMAMVRAAMDD